MLYLDMYLHWLNKLLSLVELYGSLGSIFCLEGLFRWIELEELLRWNAWIIFVAGRMIKRWSADFLLDRSLMLEEGWRADRLDIWLDEFSLVEWRWRAGSSALVTRSSFVPGMFLNLKFRKLLYLFLLLSWLFRFSSSLNFECSKWLAIF